MSYQIILEIDENSPEGQNIEKLAEAKQVSRKEAALKLLAGLSEKSVPKVGAEALRILGAFHAPIAAAMMDEALELAIREHRNKTIRQ